MDVRFDTTARSSISFVAPKVHMKSEKLLLLLLSTLAATLIVVVVVVVVAAAAVAVALVTALVKLLKIECTQWST
jgi:hypothetical protein